MAVPLIAGDSRAVVHLKSKTLGKELSITQPYNGHFPALPGLTKSLSKVLQENLWEIAATLSEQ